MSAIVEAVAVFPSKAHGSIPVLREVHVVQSWVFCVIFIRLNGQCIVCSSSNCFWLPLLYLQLFPLTIVWGNHCYEEDISKQLRSFLGQITYLLTGSSPLQHVMGGSPITKHMLDILMYKLIFSIILNINNPCLENRIYYYQRLKKTNVFIVKIYLYVIRYVFYLSWKGVTSV